MRRDVPAPTRRLLDRSVSETPVARGSSKLPRLAGAAPHVAVPPTADVRGSPLRCTSLPACLPLGRDRRPSAAARTKRQTNIRDEGW